MAQAAPDGVPGLISHLNPGFRLELLKTYSKARLALMSERHKEFWRRHPGLVWSNPEAGDEVHIRAALLRPRFDRLLDIALEFGTESLKRQWVELLQEKTAEALRAKASVERILGNIEKGFSRAAR